MHCYISWIMLGLYAGYLWCLFSRSLFIMVWYINLLLYITVMWYSNSLSYSLPNSHWGIMCTNSDIWSLLICFHLLAFFLIYFYMFVIYVTLLYRLCLSFSCFLFFIFFVNTTPRVLMSAYHIFTFFFPISLCFINILFFLSLLVLLCDFYLFISISSFFNIVSITYIFIHFNYSWIICFFI